MYSKVPGKPRTLQSSPLRCPELPPAPISRYLDSIDYILHAAVSTSMAILQLPICTS